MAGHIFRLYRSILTTDELLLLVFSALHQEDGLSEQWITSFLSENALQVMTSLVQKGFMCKEGKAFYYIDSLLIPYAILYSGQFKEDDKHIMFSMTFSFCSSLLNELCYRNSNPVDYSILRATIRKTLKALFLILNKSADQYYAHFTEIWYFHLRCTRFLLENGDLDTLRELHTDFCHVARKLTSRQGKEYKAWKKLYDLYAKFLDIEISSAHNPDGSFHQQYY
ncbi:MAG: hypothetical protein LUH55_00800 [Bacteroides thetaiotaomicron]|nr:hypothetical protein [Bacteroides thetaiotaomicron]